VYPGATYFGPRLEFAYSVFRLPSPLHLAVWWDPAVPPFAHARLPELEDAWRANHFRTVIFLKHDTIYLPDPFLRELGTQYKIADRLARSNRCFIWIARLIRAAR